MKREHEIVRDLVREYLDVCHQPVQTERRDLWRRHNSLQRTRPLIYIRAFAWSEFADTACCCTDPFYRHIENTLRQWLMRASFNDDSVFEPWFTASPVYASSGWGVESARHRPSDARGSFKFDYAIREPGDVAKLRPPRHQIDEAATARSAQRVQEAIGDLIVVNIERKPAYLTWSADISTDLGQLRGMENIMMDMMDRPEWLHELLAFMRDGVLRAQTQAEAAGDFSLSASLNQAIPYATELRDPAANVGAVKRKDLWTFAAAQEFALVSPRQHEEFLLQYQLPILKEFGLVSYGCCEDLTRKIDILRQIPNLRRIAVAPAADPRKCAEQIGTDYVLSYRPSPTDMVGYRFDPERVRRILRHDLEATRECHVDITLKEVETVEGDPNRIRKWVELARSVVEEVFQPEPPSRSVRTRR
jgi:hypothetical protein